jgi:predicted transposase/invertase (TIGR01784 family)
MQDSRKLVSLDWAIKRLLRSKSDFVILEGFLSELLFDDIKITEVLESESNKQDESDKYNRVDLKVVNAAGEIIIIEIQFDSEYDYFQRILYGTSKVICEHIKSSMDYSEIKKVISVNIVYFNLGQGSDYIYHGKTTFTGIHQHDKSKLSDKQQKEFNKQFPHELYPEYYVLKINEFDDIAKDRLDEWIYFLKNETIKTEFRAKGLKEAEDKLSIMKLSDKERKAYEYYLENKRYAQSLANTYKIDLKWERKQGIEQGFEQGQQDIIISMASNGITVPQIAQITGKPERVIEAILKNKHLKKS